MEVQVLSCPLTKRQLRLSFLCSAGEDLKDGNNLVVTSFCLLAKLATLTGSVHLSHFEDKTLKVLRSSKYSLLTRLSTSASGSDKLKTLSHKLFVTCPPRRIRSLQEQYPNCPAIAGSIGLRILLNTEFKKDGNPSHLF